MLDLVINHTGWGSREWNDHPEWFLRGADGSFHSPGAWGTVWEDLVEFDQRHVALWDYLARVFLTWCRRGVDAFRCDAGYKVPLPVWQFITARVRQEFPDTVFLLEGLGGSWEATDALLTDGGMQWAYSELFQNFGPGDVGGYLAHAMRTSDRHGTLVHYSETHDNTRLAARGVGPHAPLTPSGRRWSLHRNRIHALASLHGGFGYTNGVEWCATEQVNVHGSRGLHWGNPVNLVDELARLARLLRGHPCFFDGARLTRLDPPGARVVALRRDSAEGLDTCLVLTSRLPSWCRPGNGSRSGGRRWTWRWWSPGRPGWRWWRVTPACSCDWGREASIALRRAPSRGALRARPMPWRVPGPTGASLCSMPATSRP
jgi:starch synthase (maltosyl-transferring)